jgi:hypothetical protein
VPGLGIRPGLGRRPGDGMINGLKQNGDELGSTSIIGASPD